MGFFKDLKDDLSQAVDELATDSVVDDIDKDLMAAEEGSFDLDSFASSVEENDNKEADVQTEDVKQTANIYTIQDEEASEETDDGAVSNETAIITKGLTVVGDLSTTGSIDVFGTIEGNVTCRGKLTVSGTITGNTSSMEIFANNARIDGNVESTGTVKVGQGTVIVGNIVATSAVIAGAVKGDIDVHGPVIVDETAIIKGDIKSRTVQINNGATIDGRCTQCYSDANFDDIFAKKTK